MKCLPRVEGELCFVSRPDQVGTLKEMIVNYRQCQSREEDPLIRSLKTKQIIKTTDSKEVIKNKIMKNKVFYLLLHLSRRDDEELP